jgi:hypothetical protein
MRGCGRASPAHLRQPRQVDEIVHALSFVIGAEVVTDPATSEPMP